MAKKNIKSRKPKDKMIIEEIVGKDTPPINATLIKMIEEGNKALTDDQFFKLLKKSFGYFKTKPFQDKIAQWQLDDNRKMLNRIRTFIELEFEKAFEEKAGKDSPPIDTTFIKMIEGGDIKLTNKLFFDLVKESPEYLKRPLFIDKWLHWTIEGNNKLLNHIQTAIKPERRGRKATKTDGFKNFESRSVYTKNFKLINEFMQKHSDKPSWELNKLFKKSYPASDINFQRHYSAKELAYDLTSKELNISVRTLRKITKYVHPLVHNQE